MANRIPLVLDQTNGRLQELPNGDDLDLSGNDIVNLTSLTTTSGITVGGSLNVSGTANADEVNATTGNFTTTEATTVLTTNLTTGNLAITTNTFTINGNPLAEVAFTNSYNDLDDLPDVAGAVQSDWASNDPLDPAFILNKPTIPGNIFDLGIFDGTDGQFLKTDGTGNVFFADLPAAPGGGGAEAFTDLSDVPNDYTGFANNVLQVNGTENGLVFLNLNTLSLTSTQVTNALGFTPYDSTNPDGYFRSDADIIGALGFTPYDGTTNPNGFLTVENDNLQTVTNRGASTTSVIGVGGINATGSISITGGGNLSLDGNLEFAQTTGNITIEGQSGSNIRIGGASTVSIGGTISLENSLSKSASAGGAVTLGTSAARVDNVYSAALNLSGDADFAAAGVLRAANDLTITSTSGKVVIQGSKVEPEAPVTLFGYTRTDRDSLTGNTAGDIIYTSDDRIPQVYVPAYDGTNNTWVSMAMSYGPEPSVETVYPGMLAVSNGVDWDPESDGQEHLMCYLNGAFVTVI